MWLFNKNWFTSVNDFARLTYKKYIVLYSSLYFCLLIKGLPNKYTFIYVLQRILIYFFLFWLCGILDARFIVNSKHLNTLSPFQKLNLHPLKQHSKKPCGSIWDASSETTEQLKQETTWYKNYVALLEILQPPSCALGICLFDCWIRCRGLATEPSRT